MEIGEVFNQLTFIRLDSMTKHGHRLGLFRCDCGKEKIIRVSKVKANLTKSCGCLHEKIWKKFQFQPLPDGQAALNNLFLKYQNSAKDRGYEWHLTFDEFKTLTSGNCGYCGCAPKTEAHTYSTPYLYNGIDRIINDAGYFRWNVISACPTCNFAKRELSYDDFINHCRKVVSYNGDNSGK